MPRAPHTQQHGVNFSARAVLTKSLKRRHPASQASASDACLFYHVSRLGATMLLPIGRQPRMSNLSTVQRGSQTSASALSADSR